MAKDKLSNLFLKTSEPETTPTRPLADDLRKRRKRDPSDKVKAYSVGLRASEWEEFEKIATALNTTYHDLTVYVLRDFMARWERGERPPTETKQVLKLP